MLSDEQKFLIDFNVQDVAVALGIRLSAQAASATLDVTEDAFTAYAAQAADQVATTADRLLAEDAHLAALCDYLSKYKTILAIGDSITTYRYSWARMLAHLLAPRGVTFRNEAYSGYTSNHGLELTHTQFLSLNPDVVFIKYGVNDSKRFTWKGDATLVSLAEYHANMQSIVRAFREHCGAEVILLTPTPVVEPIVHTLPDFINMHLTWHNADIREMASTAKAVTNAQGAQLINLYEAFGDTPEAQYYLPDGLHPNAAGQKIILQTIAKGVQNV